MTSPSFGEWVESAESSAAVGAETTIIDLFEAQVAENSAAIALECYWQSAQGGGRSPTPAEEAWTRRRLQEVSLRLALELRTLLPNVANGCVGIAVDEGAAMVLLELAVCYCGRGWHFFPIDLRTPTRRVLQLLQDTKAGLLVIPEVTDTKHLELDDMSQQAGCRLVSAQVLLDSVSTSTEAESSCEWNIPRPNPHDLCYIQFTSGSTGQPKGVLCEHRQAAWYARAKALSEGIDDKSRMLLTAAFTFDPCQGDTFCALASGAALLLVRRVSLLHDLLSVVISTRATHLCATPALWRLAEGDKSNLALRCLSLGGEKMPSGMIAEWAPRLTLRNIYGVTEATVYQSAMIMETETPPQLAGLPLAGLSIAVLPWHEEGEEEPDMGEDLGEVCIAGPGVARGYLNSPELTSERFRAMSGLNCRRFYKTGDCGLWTSIKGRSVLQIVGRRDMQVKINGERIELGEVEHALNSCPLVKACAVLPWIEAGTLVAFVVMAGEEVVDGLVEVALSSHCELSLPRVMRPRRFIDLKELPVSSNGKIDRKALVLPNVSVAADSTCGESEGEALNPMESAVAVAWISELGLAGSSKLSKGSDFYALGGGSVQAVRVTRALRNVLHGGGGGGNRWAEGKSDWRDPAGDAALFLPPERAGDAECHFGLCDGGPFAPCGLLERPRLQDYAGWLESMGIRLGREQHQEQPLDEANLQQRGEQSGNEDDQQQQEQSGEELRKQLQFHSESDASAAANTATHIAATATATAANTAKAAPASPATKAAVDDRPEGRLVKALEAAIRTGRTVLAQALLVAGASPNGGLAPRDLGTRPLHWAAAQGHLEVVQQLLDMRALVGVATQQGALPAHVAAAGGHANVLGLLLRAGTPPCTRDKARQSLIHYAARRGSVDALRLAIEAGAEVNARDSQMRTALHWAALAGDLQVAKVLLLEAGATLEPPKVSAAVHRRATRLTQETPLEIALRRHPEATNLHVLLKSGALSPASTPG